MQYLVEHSRMLSVAFVMIWSAAHVHGWFSRHKVSCRTETFANYNRTRRPVALDHEPTIRIQRPPED